MNQILWKRYKVQAKLTEKNIPEVRREANDI